MPTIGEKVIAAARADLGCAESPPRSNDGACVRALQASTGAYRLPWCASAVTTWWKRAGIDVSVLGTASTWWMVEQARKAGRLRERPVPGCAVVWSPGASGHVEIYIRPTIPGMARTIGGNTGDAVREHDRSIVGAYFVVPPELEREPEPEFRTVYWWEDPAAEPTRHGLYAATASREKAVRAWVARNGNPGHVRRGKLSVRNGAGLLVPRFTFWTGERRRSPDFTDKAARDRNMAAVATQRPGHTLRPRSRRERVT